VPILLRSLAVKFATLNEHDLPVSVDIDFLMTLDTDIPSQNYYCRLVDKYEYAWWMSRKEPQSLDEVEILDKYSMAKCIQTHKEQIDGNVDGEPDLFTLNIPSAKWSKSTESTPSGTTTFSHMHSSNATPVPSVSHARPTIRAITATKRIPPTPAIQSVTCEKCLAYKNVLSNTILDVVNIQAYAKMMLTCSESQWNIDMRRASTFNQLHEAVVVKEVAGTSSTLPIPLDVESVRDTAMQELERLKKLPPTSHKWTWGERLTESEVLNLRRSGTNPKMRVHSGYDASLRPGKPDGKDSSLPTMPETLEVEENTLAEDAPSPPDNNVRPIMEYEKIRNRVYDPLGKRSEPTIFPFDSPASPILENMIPRISAKLTVENVLKHTVEADTQQYSSQSWTRDIQEKNLSAQVNVADIPALEIEDIWESDSEGKVGVGAGNVQTARSLGEQSPDIGIEDVWMSGSEDMEVCLTARPTVTVGASAEALEDLWESEVDESPSTDIKGTRQTEGRVDVENPIVGIEDEWLPASDEEIPNSGATNFSSQPTANSQFMASPSRITMERHSSFPVSDAWPDIHSQSHEDVTRSNSTLETPTAHPFRRYGPEDFPNLQEHMFEDKLSDSDWSEDEEK